MNLPDVTKAQLFGVVTGVCAALVGYGVLTPKLEQLVVTLSGVFLGAVTILADSIIRHGRSRALAPAPIVPQAGAPTQPGP